MAIRKLTSLQHPIVKHIVHLRQNHDYRDEYHSVVIVGKKEVVEIGSKTLVKALFVYDESFVPENIQAREVYMVTEEIMHKISGMMSPEGFLAEVDMPLNDDLKGSKRVIVLDGVNDPGNLGNILRTALAFGWDAFIVEGSCDPYNDKALRASRGASFRLKMGRGSWADLDRIIQDNKLEAYAADLNGTPAPALKFDKGIALILSNEARGVSAEANARAQKVTIPMSGLIESLNVASAGAILMFLLKGY